METSSVILLSISAAASFGLGRIFVHFRDKKREKQARERAARVLREQAPEPASRNRSKRKRQLQRVDREKPPLPRQR